MTHKPRFLLGVVLLIFSSILLSSCGPARSPADTIVDYLEALAANDQAGAVSSSCAAWEEKALAEGTSFVNVEVSLDNLVCETENEVGSEASVACTGKFVFSYDAGEAQELDLSGRVFSLELESGEWRMCGYQK